MVQIDASVDYDENVNQQDDTSDNKDTWTSSVREAVTEFSRRVSETSRQLAQAADKFAVDSMRVINDVTARAEESATQSSQMAASAGAAAEEAKLVAESVRSALSEAAEKVREETRSFLQEAVQQAQTSLDTSGFETRLTEIAERAEQAFASSERLQGEMETRLSSLSERSDAATRAHDESESGIETASRQAQEALAAADRVRSELEARFEEAVQRMEQSSNAGREAAAAAAVAAQEALEAASEATQQASAAPGVSSSAQEVLERLEADYSLLTRLVQELHARIATLSNPPLQALSLEPEIEGEPAPLGQQQHEPLWTAEPGAETEPETPAEEHTEATPVWSQTFVRAPEPEAEPQTSETVADQLETPGDEEAAREELTAPEAPGAEPVLHSATLTGRFLISIAPVPNFDSLLSLDGALGRMSAVENVTLADYAQEEVTFRVVLQTPTSVADFRDQLSQSAGSPIEIVSADQDGLALRLAS